MFRTTSRSFRVSASAAVLVCVAASVAESATVAGNVVDSTTSLPLAGVEVLVDGVPSGVTTDISGQFKAEVTEGERLFTFKRTGFSEQSIGPVTVAAEGETAVPPAKLAPDSANDIVMLDALDVSGELVKGGSGDLQNTRLKADVAIDFLSAEEFTKFGAGDIAESLIRVPGVSVANGQFAVIRGLSDRYTPTSLSGLKIPSPDPEKQAPQLDFLPTSLVESLVVSKTFAPNLWGETSGGSIDLAPKSFPEERKISVGFGVKANSNALEDGGPTYSIRNDQNDLFTNGSASRPAATPSAARNTAQSWDTPWDYSLTKGDTLPLGTKFSLGYGETFMLGERKLGVNVSGSWDRASKSQSGHRTRLYMQDNQGGDPADSEYARGVATQRGLGTYDYESSEVEVNINVLANVAFEISPDDSIRATSFFTRSGTDFASLSESPLVVYTEPGSNETFVVGDDIADVGDGANPAAQKFKSAQRYTERELQLHQMAGEHTFTSVHDLEVNWTAQIASTSQDEPAVTEATYYEQLGTNPLSVVDDFGLVPGTVGISPNKIDLRRFWSFTEEKQTAERLDLALPLELLTERESKLKAGVAREDTDRTYRGKEDFYRAVDDSSISLDDRSVPAGADISPIFDRLLTNLGTYRSSALNETIQSRDISAGYLGADLALPAKLKLSLGARYEKFEVSTAGRDNAGPFTTGFLYHASLYQVLNTEYIPQYENDSDAAAAHVTRVAFEDDAIYPAVGLVYQPRDKVNLRANFSQTTARPSLRELGPYFNRSLETGDFVLGNPGLTVSDVKNYDLRAEWLPTSQTMVAGSVFAKTIQNPIEKIYLPRILEPDSLETWVNNPNEATLYGAEFETRFGLGVVSELFESFSFGTNLTYIDASVEEHPLVVQNLVTRGLVAPGTKVERRLYDQPEYLANMDLTWTQVRWGTTVTLAFNVTSDVLYAAGGGATIAGKSGYDIYVRDTHRVDLGVTQKLGKHLKLRVGVKNLTDPVRGTVYDPDRTGSVIVRNEYHSGRDYSLSLSADF